MTVRVLHLIDSLTWGGAEMLLADAADGAPAAGLELEVAYLRDVDASPAAARLLARGIRPRLVPATRLHDPRGLGRVLRHVARVRPDVVHTHLGTADLLGAAAARLTGRPSFSTLHVMAFDGAGRDRVKHRAMALARARGTRVVAVSDAARDAYLATGWDRPGHVVVVRNGTGPPARAGAGRAVRDELGLAPEDVVVTMVTVLREGKGHDVAAAAAGALLPRHPGLRLLVLGDGPARAAVRRALAPLGAAAVLAGQRDDVRAVLDATDVLVHPTRVDALPTALMEAMAAGVPPVATAVGGVPELVRDGVEGRLVPGPPRARAFAAALEPLVADAALRRRLGAAGRARYAAEFTAERWAGRLRALYDDALAVGR